MSYLCVCLQNVDKIECVQEYSNAGVHELAPIAESLKSVGTGGGPWVLLLKESTDYTVSVHCDCVYI